MKATRKFSGSCRFCDKRTVVNGYWFNHYSCKPYYMLKILLHAMKHGNIYPLRIMQYFLLLGIYSLADIGEIILVGITYPAWYIHEKLS